MMERPEYIKCEADTEESSPYEPDNKMIDSDRISPELDVKDDISRLIKQEPCTEEICIKSHPDELVAVKIEQDVATTIAPVVESYERDADREVKEELDDISGSPTNEIWSSTGVRSEETSIYPQQSEEGRLLSPLIHNFPHKTVESSSMCINVKSYSCSTCFKEYACESSLVYHMRTHSDERPYNCNECNLGFKQRKTLLGHLATHTNIKAHKCSNCFKDFRTRWDLRRHMSSHSNEKPYTCIKCGQRYKGRNALRLHLLTHTNVKAHTCTTCDKEFRTKSALAFHARTHSDERPYTCDGCGQGFKTRQHISRHFYRNGKSCTCHNNAKSHVCSRCFKPFRSKLSLSIHMRIHMSEMNAVKD